MRNKEAKDTVHTQRRERIKHLQYKGKEKRSRGWYEYVARDGTKQFSRKFRNIGFSRDKKLCYVWETQNICFELISQNYLNKQFRSTSNPTPPRSYVVKCMNVCVYIYFNLNI